ncbi:MAG: hypothetical protein ACP5VE_03010 [Chthonomonadales bacterium]
MSLEDLAINEVTCFECGKPIPSIPSWLSTAKVKFQCDECRQRHPRPPGMVELDPHRVLAHADDVVEDLDETPIALEDDVEEDADLLDEADDLAE